MVRDCYFLRTIRPIPRSRNGLALYKSPRL